MSTMTVDRDARWAEIKAKSDEIARRDEPPLFGHRSGRGGLTHWLVFMNPPPSQDSPKEET